MIKDIVKSPNCLSGGKREGGEFSTGWETQGRSLGLESWGARRKVLPPTLRGRAWVCLSGPVGHSPSLRTLRRSPLCLLYLQALLITPTHAVTPSHPPCALLLHVA